ncbi:MAG: SDR family oxidoreductase [Pelolinea sp.]|nr:SDR family oxidoreductase [Pelolinea sp.]
MIDLTGKKIIITGSARRIGKELALASAEAGASVILHHNHSTKEVSETASQIQEMGTEVEIIRSDFSTPETAIQVYNEIFRKHRNIYALVNNAAIFKPVKFTQTSLEDWQIHMNVNLTMPFLLSQLFANSLGNNKGRIINILDWRALRPGYDHFPYTISKSALAALTRSTALSLAPNIQVNGIALGAILPASDGAQEDGIINKVPAKRWATTDELRDVFLFLLQGPEYITGEIIHLDGGRHLV